MESRGLAWSNPLCFVGSLDAFVCRLQDDHRWVGAENVSRWPGLKEQTLNLPRGRGALGDSVKLVQNINAR